MRRSRPLPMETMAAISIVLITSLVALVVLVRHVDDREGVQTAGRSPLSSVPVDEAPPVDPVDPAVTTTTSSPSSPTTSPSPAPTTFTPSTTSTTQVPGTGPPAPPGSMVEAPPECPGLVSDTYWTGTGEDSVLVVGAGGTARYAEVVTNESDEPCVLSTNRCGSTAELRTSTGEPTDPPSRACSSERTEEVLEPGAERTEELTVSFPVPPGEYRVHIRRYDGTAVDLPVRLDDRLPACAPDALGLQVNGEQQFREQSEIRDSGARVDLIVTGAPESCTVRTVESALLLDDGEEQIDLVDETDRWLTDTGEIGILTHMVVPPTDLPPGQYEGLVTVVLESGEELTAPLELLVR